MPWLKTYETTHFGTSQYLPIEEIRFATLDKQRPYVWAWVYGCRKIQVPANFPEPGPGIEWHPNLHLWIGPDGHVIRKFQEKMLLAKRKQLQKALTQEVRTNRMTEDLGFVGEAIFYFLPP
jgi:hypothetical protein